MDQNRLKETLKATSDIDLDALRAKYANRAKQSEGKDKDERTKSKDVNAVLSKYSICQGCGGTGMQKSIYNHRVMEKTCEVCDGDVLLKKATIESSIAMFKKLKGIEGLDALEGLGDCIEQDLD